MSDREAIIDVSDEHEPAYWPKVDTIKQKYLFNFSLKQNKSMLAKDKMEVYTEFLVAYGLWIVSEKDGWWEGHGLEWLWGCENPKAFLIGVKKSHNKILIFHYMNSLRHKYHLGKLVLYEDFMWEILKTQDPKYCVYNTKISILNMVW